MRGSRLPQSNYPDLGPRNNVAAYIVLFLTVVLLIGGYWFLIQRFDTLVQIPTRQPIPVSTVRPPVFYTPAPVVAASTPVAATSLGPLTTPTPAPMRLARPDWEIPGGHFYTQGSGQPAESLAGFAVVDINGAPLHQQFQRLGGVQSLGYPLSNGFMWHDKPTQIFQRAVLHWNPQTNQIEFMNVMNELHAIGRDEWMQQQFGVPMPLPAEFDAGKSWEQIVHDRLRLLDPVPGLRDHFYATPEPMLRYGLPDSLPENQGNRIAMRFQRAVLLQWTQPPEGVRPNEVTLLDVGAIAIQAGLFPVEPLVPIAPPEGTVPLVPATDQATVPAVVAQPTQVPTAASAPVAIVATPTPTPPPATATPAVTPTAAPGAPQQVTVGNTNGDGVYIRRTPNLNDRLRAWPDNTPLQFLGETTQAQGMTWLKVRDPAGNEGWVPQQYTVGAPAPAAATPTPTPAAATPTPVAATPTPTPAAQGTLRVGNTGGVGVYIRRTPNLDDRLRAWVDGTPMIHLGETATQGGQHWIKVQDPAGNVGWIPSQYLVE